MPTVPTYDNYRVGVATPSLGRVANTTPDIDAGRSAQQLGQAMQQGGAALGQMALDQAATVNEAKVKELDNQAAAYLRATLNDPQKGYLNQRGGKAVDGYEAAQKDLSETFTKFGDTLTNEAQKLMWEQVKARRLGSAQLQIDEHASRQRTVYAGEQSAARVNSSAQDMIVNVGKPELYNTARATMLAEVGNLADLQGASPERRAEMREDTLSKAHIAVSGSLMSQGAPMAALNYYKEHKDEIAPDQRGQLESKLTEAAGAAMAVAVVDEVWSSKGPKGPNDPVDLDAMDTELRTRFKDNPFALKAAREELSERRQNHDYTQNETNTAALQSVNEMFLNGASLGAIRKTDAWAAMPAAKRMQFQEHVESIANARANRAAAEESREFTRLERIDKIQERNGMMTYYTLTDPNNPLGVSSMTETDVRKLQPRVGVRIVGALLDAKRAQKSPALSDDFINKTIADSGLIPNPFGKMDNDDKAKAGYLRSNIYAHVNAVEDAKGRKLTPQEAESEVRNAVGQAVRKPGWFGETTTASPRAVALSTPAAQLPPVPAKDRSAVAGAMQRVYNQTGRPEFAPSEENLRRFYMANK